MKRKDLERRLRIAGCYLKREGSSHSLWINRKKKRVEKCLGINSYFMCIH